MRPLSFLGDVFNINSVEQSLNPSPFERSLVQGLLLLKNTIKNFAYTVEKESLLFSSSATRL